MNNTCSVIHSGLKRGLLNIPVMQLRPPKFIYMYLQTRGVETLKITITYLLLHQFLESDKLNERKDQYEVSYQSVPLKFRKWWKMKAEIQRYAKLLLKTEVSCHCSEMYTTPQSGNRFTAITRPIVSGPSFGDLYRLLESLLVRLGLWPSRCSIVVDGWRNWSSSFRRLRHLFALPACAALASATLGDLLHSPLLGRLGAEVWGLLLVQKKWVRRERGG